jgi:eukaryotic-like serine/threonine-protein kinase
MACPDDDELAALIDGTLEASRRSAIMKHVERCVACGELVSSALGGSQDRSVIVPGSTVGRYRVTRLLGAGGMGIVYEAVDPELDRRVAIKVLRPDAGTEPVERLRSRLLREARSLARLAHPNVITVHDVGEHEGAVFVAMEHVTGGTLRAWLLAAPRAVDDVLDLFVQAGRGLSAAHVTGIVHRDFKPDNVLVGEDGRVRVADFGLARSDAAADDVADGDANPPPAETLTRTGALAGTPRYMAPEQRAGEPATTLSDQYAFCIALGEALSGTEDSDRKRTGRSRAVPSWLRALVARGLSATPSERWPSMAQLVSAIEHARLSRRRRPWRRSSPPRARRGRCSSPTGRAVRRATEARSRSAARGTTARGPG